VPRSIPIAGPMVKIEIEKFIKCSVLGLGWLRLERRKVVFVLDVGKNWERVEGNFYGNSQAVESARTVHTSADWNMRADSLVFQTFPTSVIITGNPVLWSPIILSDLLAIPICFFHLLKVPSLLEFLGFPFYLP
jgi:hypothetical protein